MLQPRFKKMADGKSRNVFITNVKSLGYRFDPVLARRLLLYACQKHNANVNYRKEQPCQFLQSQQSSTATLLKLPQGGNGTEIQEHAFGQPVMTPLNFMLTVVKPPKTNFQISFLAKRLTCGQRTRSTVDGLSVMSFSGAETWRNIFRNINRGLCTDVKGVCS